MNKLAGLMLLLPALAAAQNPEPPKPPAEIARKVVELKHLSGTRAERAANLLYRFLQPGGFISIDPELRTAVLAGPPDAVAAAEALLRKFDVPGDKGGAQVTLTLHMIEASPEEGRGGATPKEIASAVEQMEQTFSYKSYRLLDTILLVGRGNAGAVASGLLPTEPVRGEKATYEAAYETLQVYDDAKTIGLKLFRVNLEIPSPAGGMRRTALRTDVSLQEGQKLVIGKLSADQANNAIFVVLTADIQ